MSNFSNKVVLITGATGALGSSVTKAFLDAGATVEAISRSTHGDLSSPERAAEVVGQIKSRLGRIDVLAHLVGAFAPGSDAASFDRMLEVNLKTTVLMVNAVLPHMLEQKNGRIVVVGSRAAVEPTPGAAAYAASKAAVVSFIQSLAAEKAGSGISANVVLPGTMDTEVNRKAMPDADFSKWVPTEQVARLILSLASDDLSQISGAAIPIYGA